MTLIFLVAVHIPRLGKLGVFCIAAAWVTAVARMHRIITVISQYRKPTEPRVNRSEVCAAAEVQVFRLINRCVRTTYLCGKDRRSGKGCPDCKEWIRKRLEELAGIFGVDVVGYAVMSKPLARRRRDAA